jgi:two-component system, sensor histidine kinase and response regulator
MVRILVIEDEDNIRENIVEILDLNDYDVDRAENGLAGIELAHERVPDLILCDIMMPGMDGYEVLEHIRRKPDTALTPFIFLTAKSDRTSMRYGMELGADDYIPKPFTNEELLTAVQARISRFEDVEESANEKLLETKQQLAHVISHELRTPLTSINMAVQLMSQQLDFLSTENIHDLVETLGSGTNRLNRLVEQISLFIQAQSGFISPEKIKKASRTEVLWTLILGAINRSSSFIYREHNVQVNFNPDQNAIEVRCFRDLMIHALAEVIANSIAYSPDDGRVDITVEEFQEGVRICVADSGKGMSEEQVQLALQEFTQIDREKYEQQGIGIGLSLTNLIIQSHGGQLSIESEVGVGTRVNIDMPY